MLSNWQLIKVGFFLAFGWWLAASASEALDFIVQTVYVIVMHGGQGA